MRAAAAACASTPPAGRLRTLVAAVLILGGLAVTPAAARWSAPQQVLPATLRTLVSQGDVAVDARGRALVAFGLFGLRGTVPQVVERPGPGARFGRPFVLGPLVRGTEGGEPRLAAGRGGAALAVWAGERGALWAARRTRAGAPWRAGVRFSAGALLALSIGSRGEARVVILQGAGRARRLRVLSQTAGPGPWRGEGAALALPTGSEPRGLAVTLSPTGAALAVWPVRRQGGVAVLASLRPPAAAWEAPRQLTPPAPGDRDWVATAALDDRGTAAAGWAPVFTGEDPGSPPNAVSLRAAGAPDWEAPVRLGNGYPALALREGAALAAWADDGLGAVRAAFRPAGAAAWGPVERAGRVEGEGGSGVTAVSLDGPGRARVAWVDDPGPGPTDNRVAVRFAGRWRNDALLFSESHDPALFAFGPGGIGVAALGDADNGGLVVWTAD